MKLCNCESRLSRRTENSGGNGWPDGPGNRGRPSSSEAIFRCSEGRFIGLTSGGTSSDHEMAQNTAEQRPHDFPQASVGREWLWSAHRTAAIQVQPGTVKVVRISVPSDVVATIWPHDGIISSEGRARRAHRQHEHESSNDMVQPSGFHDGSSLRQSFPGESSQLPPRNIRINLSPARDCCMSLLCIITIPRLVPVVNVDLARLCSRSQKKILQTAKSAWHLEFRDHGSFHGRPR
jgi:hypothetical protein